MKTAEHLLRNSPELTHFTTGSHEMIVEHGLHSTASVLASATGLAESDLNRILKQVRPESIPVEMVDGRTVVVRDQRPLLGKLDRALVDGVTAAEYLSTLNQFTYLHPSTQSGSEYKDGLVGAYGGTGQVLVFDRDRLLTHVGDRLQFTRYNTGAVDRDASRRYKSLEDWRSAEEVDYAPAKVQEIAVEGYITPREIDSILLRTDFYENGLLIESRPHS